MKNKLSILFTLLVLISCSNEVETPVNKPKQKLTKSQIQSQMEALSDSLDKMTLDMLLSNGKMDKEQGIALQTKISVARQELINQNIEYFHSFPEDSLAPHSLINIYKLYEGIQAYQKALNYIDSLEHNYPNYEFLNEYLEMKAVTLDYFIQPRDTSIIRDAYEYLLSLPNLPSDRVKNYTSRLSNLDKDLNAFIP